MGCFPSKHAEQVHPATATELQSTNENHASNKPEGGSNAALTASAGRLIQAPASSRASTPGTRKVSPIAKSEPILQQAAAAGAPESVLAKPNSLAYEIPLDPELKATGSDGLRKSQGGKSSDGVLQNGQPFQVTKPETDPEELLKKIEQKEALAAERRAAELAAKQEALKAAEEHAKLVKERKKLAGADEVGMEGNEVRRSSRKIGGEAIVEEEEEGH